MTPVPVPRRRLIRSLTALAAVAAAVAAAVGCASTSRERYYRAQAVTFTPLTDTGGPSAVGTSVVAGVGE